MKRLACSLLFASMLSAQPVCAIRGIVVDALTKQPLPRAQVFAERDSDSDDDSAPAVRRTTDSHGAFCFESLTAGKYSLRVTRSFYIDANYGERWPGDTGEILPVAVGEPLSPLTIKMMPQAVISGVLVDTDEDPLQGARINLLRSHWKRGKLTEVLVQNTTTDDKGRYRFASLPAGTYFVAAVPGPQDDSPFVRQFLDQSGQPFRQISGKTYYKNAISFHDAMPIRVGAGQEVSNLTLTLRKADLRHVSGHVPQEALNTWPRILYFTEEVSGGPVDDGTGAY